MCGTKWNYCMFCILERVSAENVLSISLLSTQFSKQWCVCRTPDVAFERNNKKALWDDFKTTVSCPFMFDLYLSIGFVHFVFIGSPEYFL